MDGPGTLKREHRQRRFLGVEAGIDWKLLGYILGTLDWRSLGDTQRTPELRKEVRLRYGFGSWVQEVSEALGWMSQGVCVDQEERTKEEVWE